MRLNKRSIAVFCMLILFGTVINVFAQVNIETLRRKELDEGLHMNLATTFGLLAGNSDNTTISGNFRADYLRGDYHYFSVADWNRGKSNDKLYEDSGFIHFRGTKKLTKVYAVEAFAQEEYNDFILLKERNLVGGGMRFTPLTFTKDKEDDPERAFHFGMGLMHENERFSNKTDEANTTILRSTNYCSIKWGIKDNLVFATTLYYQVDVTRIADFRIIAEGNLGFNLTEQLLFTINYKYRYDNDPPQGLRDFDLDLTNGLTYLF